MPGGKLNWVVLALTAVTFLACADAAGADVAFTAATNIATSANNPTQIATADFNNDGLADLASADCADRCGSVPAGGIGSAAVLLGNGAGGFSAAPGTPLTPPAGMEGPDVLTAADFDDNGRTDVAVLYNLTNEEAVYLGRKSSTNLFQTPIDEGTDGGGTEGTAAGDIDGDGKLDLVVARGASGMAVRLGDGTGNLAAPSAVIPGTNGSPIAPENVALADLDLDGDLDAVAGLLGGGILVLRNSPIGTFTVVDRIGAGDSGRDIDVGDMNEDGRPDVILSAEGHSVSVLLGRSGLDFDPPVTFPSSGGDVEEAVVADFTGDRHLDVAVRTDVAATAVDVFQGDGRGSLARVATLASSTSEDGQVGIAAPDVNGDGAPDIVATNSTNHGLSLYRNLPIAAVGSADFDDTATGARSLERTIEVRNRGAAPLAITAANITGANAADFTKTSDGCTSVTLPRNGTCEVTVRFVPTTAGSRAATLTIDPAEPALSNVSGALTGRGVAPPPAPAAGPQGPAGPAGADGADGADGANGAPGAQGPAGPAGQQGATGQQGAQGPAGPQGPAGRDATVTCKPGKAKKGKVKVTCTVRLAARAKRLAKLVRRGKVYAVGRSNGSRGSLRLKPRRRITRGTYTLLVKITGSDGESVTVRQRVMVR